jgi:hypothetical protein
MGEGSLSPSLEGVGGRQQKGPKGPHGPGGPHVIFNMYSWICLNCPRSDGYIDYSELDYTAREMSNPGIVRVTLFEAGLFQI